MVNESQIQIHLVLKPMNFLLQHIKIIIIVVKDFSPPPPHVILSSSSSSSYNSLKASTVIYFYVFPYSTYSKGTQRKITLNH